MIALLVPSPLPPFRSAVIVRSLLCLERRKDLATASRTGQAMANPSMPTGEQVRQAFSDDHDIYAVYGYRPPFRAFASLKEGYLGALPCQRLVCKLAASSTAQHSTCMPVCRRRFRLTAGWLCISLCACPRHVQLPMAICGALVLVCVGSLRLCQYAWPHSRLSLHLKGTAFVPGQLQQHTSVSRAPWPSLSGVCAAG